MTLELQERVSTGMKVLIFNFDGQRVVTSSITNASKIALGHFGQLYCELMIFGKFLEKISKILFTGKYTY